MDDVWSVKYYFKWFNWVFALFNWSKHSIFVESTILSGDAEVPKCRDAKRHNKFYIFDYCERYWTMGNTFLLNWKYLLRCVVMKLRNCQFAHRDQKTQNWFPKVRRRGHFWIITYYLPRHPPRAPSQSRQDKSYHSRILQRWYLFRIYKYQG